MNEMWNMKNHCYLLLTLVAVILISMNMQCTEKLVNKVKNKNSMSINKDSIEVIVLEKTINTKLFKRKMLHKLVIFVRRLIVSKTQADKLYNLKYNHSKTSERDVSESSYRRYTIHV
ncbi:MAG: hypothetical protein CM15mV18_0140 [uncultured marine virus]|nr:MAG: hypothetical protein CM15mV18_0140 [uncultured marine virus]